MSLRDQLQQVHDDYGKLTPDLLIEVATPKSHPLHSRFEWDDKLAGPAWRRHQAHDLITSVKVVTREATDTQPAHTVRAFHAIRSEQGFVYQPADVVADDPMLRALVLHDMERDWQQLKRRYSEFVEFLDMVKQDVAA